MLVAISSNPQYQAWNNTNNSTTLNKPKNKMAHNDGLHKYASGPPALDVLVAVCICVWLLRLLVPGKRRLGSEKPRKDEDEDRLAMPLFWENGGCLYR